MAKIFDIRLRHGTASAWTAANPVLGVGEPGVETDTGMFKIGNAAGDAWNTLGYAALTTAAGDTRYILAASKGAVNGVATLDASGKIPSGQLPAAPKLVTVATVANQAARLALPADDDAMFVVQTDTSTTYMIAAGADPTVNGNWIALPQPGATGLQAISEKDAANGYAGLDGTGKLKVAEFPTIDGGTP